ncbi:hypothetical protein RhiirA4_485294 [Rhizophagus irregularis]|uniref:Uncharacterized protein n=1 Tax=Rhizophagus irregularis TaxID=588596 RepID=A0A2I1HPY1_9GLOM|nr:hypothetical protein RhiirA4_485294 [Rhizophagus irregularis]
MKLKVKISKEELRKVEEKLNDSIEIEFHDENNMRLKNWVITCEIITEKLFNEEKIELDEIIIGESDNSSENRNINDNSEFNTEKDENNENDDENNNDDIVINENNGNNEINNEIQKNEEESELNNNIMTNEEIVKSENYQVLMIKLKHKKENIDEEMLERENEILSLLQLCHKMRRNNLMLLEIHYYLGKRFEERLEQEINKRKRKSRKRKTDKEEREKIYKEMMETGKKRVFESSCDIISVDNCTKKEIVEITEYFTSIQEMEE